MIHFESADFWVSVYFQSLNINVIRNSNKNDIFIQGDSFFDEKNKRCPILNDILLSYAMTRQFNLQWIARNQWPINFECRRGIITSPIKDDSLESPTS